MSSASEVGCINLAVVSEENAIANCSFSDGISFHTDFKYNIGQARVEEYVAIHHACEPG